MAAFPGGAAGMNDTPLELVSAGSEKTRQIGFDIGRLVTGGELILLIGELGAGKTCLAQGIARGAGFDGIVSSPSFVLVREYQGRVPIFHVDLYRLEGDPEVTELGLDEFMGEDRLCIIEWAERAAGLLPPDNLSIRLEHLAPEQRRLSLKPRGKRYEDILRQLSEQWN